MDRGRCILAKVAEWTRNSRWQSGGDRMTASANQPNAIQTFPNAEHMKGETMKIATLVLFSVMMMVPHLLCFQLHSKKISLLKWIVRSRVYRPQKASLRRRELSGAATEYRRSNTSTPLSRNWSRQNSGHDSITTSSEACNHPRGKAAGATWPLFKYG